MALAAAFMAAGFILYIFEYYEQSYILLAILAALAFGTSSTALAATSVSVI